MINDDRTKIKIDKKNQLRTKDISKMISEGGMGAYNYYDIETIKRIKINKEKELRTKEISKMIGEGGLGADDYYDIEKISTEPSAKPRNRS